MSYPSQTHKQRYANWRNMMNRCYDETNQDYAGYGGRGIKVCTEWHDRKKYYEYLAKKPEGTSIDRIDNDGDYTPNNCKWATPKEQALNRRSNRKLTYKGRTQSITVWADELGIKRTTLIMRINKYKWSTEKALCTTLKSD